MLLGDQALIHLQVDFIQQVAGNAYTQRIVDGTFGIGVKRFVDSLMKAFENGVGLRIFVVIGTEIISKFLRRF